jgi:hypothetical protein
MKVLLRAAIVCGISLTAAAALTACTRDAPNASASQQVVASVIQPAPDSDMPEVVITASRSGNSVLAVEESKAARRL